MVHHSETVSSQRHGRNTYGAVTHTPLPPPRQGASRLFRSFWIAGFESATHINQAGMRIDMVSATQHDIQVEQDYARLADWDISTVRDGARWHLIETSRGFD